MSDYLSKSDMTESDTAPGTSMPELVLPPQQLTLDLPTARAGQAANAAAAKRTFAQYRERVADETRRRHDSDLATFATYLVAFGVDATAQALFSDPASWAGMTWGLVAGFVAWQSQQGYAIGSINVRLSTVKAYAKRAMQAGTLSADDYTQIRVVAGFRHAEGRRVDAKREQTRREGSKKAAPVRISAAHASLLKQQAKPLDRLLMCLLLDHGLRVGEVAALTAGDFDLSGAQLRFYRSKVDKTQTHQLSADTLAAALACQLPPGSSPLFGVDRTIRRKVEALGEAVGIPKLSPHDCRHYWATAAIRGGTDIKSLQDAGGWSSPAMPLRYAESAEIANDGVKLR
jgi:integrase